MIKIWITKFTKHFIFVWEMSDKTEMKIIETSMTEIQKMAK